MLGRPHNDLDFTTSARPERDRAAARRLGRRDLGHGPRLRHHRLPQGRLARRDHDVPLGGLRPELAQARRWTSATPWPATWCAATSRSTRWRSRCPAATSRTRTAGSSTSPTGVLRTPGRPEDSLLRRPAADAAGRPVRRPARLHGGPGGGRGDDRDGRPDRDHLRRAGARRAGQAGLRAPPAARPDPARRDRAGRARAARAAGAGARARRAPPAQGRLRAHADRAGAGDRPRGPAARRRPRLRVPVRRADARRRQAADPAVPRRRHGHLPPPRRGRRQADPQADEGAAVLQRRHRRRARSWSSCTCGSTATARASGPTPRSAATSATPATSSSGCTC